MDLWLGSNAVVFDRSSLSAERQGYYGIVSLWAAGDEGFWESLPVDKISPRQWYPPTETLTLPASYIIRLH